MRTHYHKLLRIYFSQISDSFTFYFIFDETLSPMQVKFILSTLVRYV